MFADINYDINANKPWWEIVWNAVVNLFNKTLLAINWYNNLDTSVKIRIGLVLSCAIDKLLNQLTIIFFSFRNSFCNSSQDIHAIIIIHLRIIKCLASNVTTSIIAPCCGFVNTCSGVCKTKTAEESSSAEIGRYSFVPYFARKDKISFSVFVRIAMLCPLHLTVIKYQLGFICLCE